MANIPFITYVSHGEYGVDPMDIPLCGACDQPMFDNEELAIQTCDTGPHNPKLVRLTHRDCILDEDEDEDGHD